MALDQIWLLSRGLRLLRSGQAARQYLACGSAAKLVSLSIELGAPNQTWPDAISDQNKKLTRAHACANIRP